ncbi:MAG: DUF1232 domain-containing protein [Planctomycetaceae bacterium]|nr:DUF1232 domain-containing protein [Planctomycetaceae bacterium]
MSSAPVPTKPNATPEKPSIGGALLLLCGAMIYMVSPIDLIPDVVPLVGILDDISIMGMALKRVCASLA